MKKTILTMMVTMVVIASIGANVFMNFKIHELNKMIKTSCIRAEEIYVSPARYSYGGQIYTEDGHVFIYESESYDKICPIDGIAIEVLINDNGTPYKIEDDRVITIWEDKENLTSIKDIAKKEELTAILERKKLNN